jgi:hypothetical protein
MGKSKLPVEKLKASKSKPIPVKIVSEPASVSSKYAEEDRKWRARDDMRTLQQAKEIEADKARMQAVKSMAKEELAKLKKIC